MSMLDFQCRALVLLLLAVASTVGTSLVPQCSKPPTTLQILFYGITPTTQRVCLLSGVTYFANLSVNGSADTFTSSPRTAAACAYNSSIYLNQSALNGTGSIAFQQSSSGNAFEVVYAPRGLYVNSKTVIAVTAGDLPPIDTIWLSYDISSWQVCELVNGTQLQPSIVITAFDVEPKCLVSSIVSAGNIRAIRLAFNSSLVPIGNHTLVLIDGSYACGSMTSSSSFVSQPVILIVTQAASTQNNTTTDMPSPGNATMPTRIKPEIIATIVVVITTMVITVMVIIVMVMVIVGVIKMKRRKDYHNGENKTPPLGQLELCDLDGEAKLKIAPPTSLSENGPVEAQTRVMVVIEKDAEWVPLLSTKLCDLHKCSCDVVEFNDDIVSKLEDPRCQRVYAVCSNGPSSKPMDEFVAKLSRDVVANKLLLAHFGAPDKHMTSEQQAAISHPMQLEVGTVESCAAMLYEAHLGRSSKPPPLSIADISDVIPDRSLSATPPGSATQLLEDSGRGSFTNSDQNTPNVQHRPKNIFHRDHSSLVISAIAAKVRDIAEYTKEIKGNTNYLVDEGQKKLADERESIALPGPDAL